MCIYVLSPYKIKTFTLDISPIEQEILRSVSKYDNSNGMILERQEVESIIESLDGLYLNHCESLDEFAKKQWINRLKFQLLELINDT